MATAKPKPETKKPDTRVRAGAGSPASADATAASSPPAPEKPSNEDYGSAKKMLERLDFHFLAELAKAYYGTHQRQEQRTVAASGMSARQVMETIPCGCDLCVQYRALTEKD